MLPQLVGKVRNCESKAPTYFYLNKRACGLRPQDWPWAWKWKVGS